MKRIPILSAVVAAFLLGLAPLEAQKPARATLFTRAEDGLVRAVLEIDIEFGWHIYHSELGHPEAIGLPTKVAFEAEGVEWSQPLFPEPHELPQGLDDSEGNELWIWGHEGLVRIYAAGTYEGEAPTKVAASIQGQVCKESCIPYFDDVTSKGKGKDTLFASFPDALLPKAAQKTGGAQREDVHVEGEADATLYTRVDGDSIRAAVEIRITPGWHLYHEELGGTEYAKPTVITLGGKGIEWGELDWPEPEKLDLGFDDQWVWSHEGTIVVRAEGRLAEGAKGEDVSAEIAGQTCTDVCINYTETAWSRGPGPDELFAGFAPAESSKGTGTSGATSSEDTEGRADALTDEEEDSLWDFILLAIAGGLFALVMPCTYPMIPITISYFTKQADARGGRVLPLSLTYGGGIVLIFVLIGVILGPPIIRFATHPFTNIVIGLAFLYFALVLFGIVKLEPPRALMNVAGKASMKGGYTGIFLMGATLVVTSFTCTAPFVGSLLSYGASQGGIGRVALGMGVFGLTMAIPFVILSLIPGRLRAMPKSGQWMNTLKFVLGFVELAASLKFFSNAEIVWDLQILSRELFLLLWGVIFLLASLYLFGLFTKGGDKPGTKRLTSGALLLVFAGYCLWGMTGVKLDRVMTAIAPNYSGGRFMPALYDPGGDWLIVKDAFELANQNAREQDKLLLVNFTGFT